MSARLESAPGAGDVTDRFARLWDSLETVPDAGDRRVMLDCVRDALDRGAGRLSGDAKILAGTYAVEAVIAEGATGIVLRARHRDLGHLRAIKTLRPDRSNDPLLRRLMLREAESWLCVRHPAVVEAETALRLEDGRPAIVMALVDGPSLVRRLEDGPLPLAETIALGRRLADGLSAIHAAGFAHLDLTPANVLLPDGDGSQAQICDFGLAQPLGRPIADADIGSAGTPGFTAPELADRSRPIDARADLYALGAVMRRAIGGAETGAIRGLVERLASEDPGDRPACALETRAAIDLAASGAVA